MEHLHLLLLSDNDAKRVATIIANVPDISSPQAAMSWALNNVQIPSGEKPVIFEWVQVNPDAFSPGTTTPIKEPEDSIPLPPQHHTTEVVKIHMGNLARLKASAIVEVGALRQIASSATDQAAVLQDVKLGVLK